MESRTNNGEIHNGAFNRIICLEIFLWIVFVVTTYVLCAMLQYERNTKKNTKMKVRSRSGGLFKIKINDFARAMRTCVIMATCGAIMRNICEHMEILFQLSIHDHCNLIMDFKFFFGMVFFSGIYTFLWMRQRVCYTNQAMKHLSNSSVRCYSWFTIVFIFMTGIIVALLLITTQTHTRKVYGCEIEGSRINSYVPYIVLTAATIFFQITLAVLFIYPIVKHNKQVHASTTATTSTRYNGYMKLIRRTLLVLCFNVTVSIIVMLLQAIVGPIDPYNVTGIISYNINILVHLFAIIFTYPNWKVRMLSFCKRDIDISDYVKQNTQVQVINAVSIESSDKFVTSSGSYEARSLGRNGIHTTFTVHEENDAVANDGNKITEITV